MSTRQVASNVLCYAGGLELETALVDHDEAAGRGRIESAHSLTVGGREKLGRCATGYHQWVGNRDDG